MAKTYKHGILVEVTEDRMGNILLRPKNEQIRKKMMAHTKEHIGSAEDTVFLQEGGPASEFMERLPRRLQNEMQKGWGVTLKIDPWEFGHYVGYDFHEVI